MKRLVLLVVLLACLIAVPALAQTRGDYDLGGEDETGIQTSGGDTFDAYGASDWANEGDADDDNNEVIWYRYIGPDGHRDSWIFGVKEWNEVNANHNGRGVQLRNEENHPEQSVELYLDVEDYCGGYAGIFYDSRNPDEAVFCIQTMREYNWTESERDALAVHEIGHAVRLDDRPCDHGNRSIMAGVRCSDSIRPQNGDINVWEYVWINNNY